MNIFVRLEPHITLKDEYLYRPSIRQLHLSGISKYCSASKRNWWFTLPKASAKSIKTDVNLVLLWGKLSNAVLEYEWALGGLFYSKRLAAKSLFWTKLLE